MKRFLVKLGKNTSTSSTSHEQQTNINAASTSSVNDIDLEGNNNPKKLKGQVPSTSLRRIAPVTVDLSISIKNGPKQPKVNYPRRNIGGKQRSFQSTWYDKYSWMEYSVKNDAIFCFFCRHFSATEKKTNHRESLTNTGFNDWKNISKMAEKHENSNFHKNCLTKYKGWLDFQKSGSVSIKINEHMAQTVEKNRQTLKTLIRSVLFCARQNIALRGHREVKKCYKEDEDTDNNSTDDEGGNCPEGSNRGNFKELVNLLCLENSDFDTNIKNMPKNAKYTSKDIQNDILDAASKLVTKGIVDEINASNIYSIIVDEARDEGCKEQMSICCRYIHESKIKERFLGFVELQELTAESLASKIKEFLESIGLDLKNCVSQSFDGASVMSGRCNGLHTLIRETTNNPCFYVYCHAHRLNLVLVDVAKNVKIIGETMGPLEAIYAFQSCSTLRYELFVFSKETETGKKIITVPQHSDTRWVAKYKGVQFFKNHLGSVINALQKCALSTKPREAAEARGLLAQIKSFDVAFALVCLEGILQLVNILSKQLQSSTIDIGKCIKLVKATIDHLGHLRTDTQFAKFIQETQELCKTCNIDLNTDSGNSRRKQKPTGSLDAYVIMDTIGKGRHEAEFESNFMKLKAEYFSILDSILGEMGKRFNDNDLPITCISACDPKSPDFLNPQVLCSFAELQGKDTDFLSTLKVQCGLAKSMFGSAKDGLDVLKDLDDFPSFKELKLIMTILMAMPVSTATAERTFSTMRRIKSNLRATMTGKRLSSLGVLSIENEASYELLKNPEPVIDEFASQKGRRLQFVMK